MDTASQVKMLVRSLTKSGSGKSTGAPLACFFVMLTLRQEHPDWWSVEELMDATGYDQEGIAKARAALVALGQACAGPGGRGIRLTDAAGRQYALPGGFMSGSDQPIQEAPTTTTIELLVEEAEKATAGSDHPIQRGGANSCSPAVPAALAAAGIGEPTRSQLAADPWLTPERVRLTAEAKRRENKGPWAVVLDLRSHVEPPGIARQHPASGKRVVVGAAAPIEAGPTMRDYWTYVLDARERERVEEET